MNQNKQQQKGAPQQQGPNKQGQQTQDIPARDRSQSGTQSPSRTEDDTLSEEDTARFPGKKGAV